jgi:2-succinyl-5-enolpyruvyl-6-hydroxy-3-cyclohexene-1-carboxylate synthase
VSFAALQAAWAEWLLEGLLAGGVRRAVVSPGSRSTPLVLAIGRAEAERRLDVTVVVDERAAAFFALGEGRFTNEPSLLVCTSGTAGAHYLPALVEAAESRVPILALTADRPPELRGRGAAQTIQQSGMYAHFVRRTFEVGPAEPDPRAVDGLLRTGVLAVHATRWPDPGPVHINAAFRKPLEPDGGEHPDVEALSRRVAETLRAGLATPDLPTAVPPQTALDAVAERLDAAARGLLLLGPCGPASAPSAEAVSALARATGFPVLAEATSQHRFGAVHHGPALDVSEPLFASARFLERGAPDLVLQVGGAPTGRALGAWIADSGVERIVLARHGVPEAFNQAARIIIGDLEPTLRGLVDRLAVRRQGQDDDPAAGAAPDWLEEVARAADHARSLATEDAGRAGSQGEAVRAAVDAAPGGGVLIVGNSMTVRDVDLYVPARDRDITVLAQRGAAGIDGLIAGAAGSAGASGRPTLLLLGDVSFQHDVGGLAAAGVETPLAIVVIRNGGGRLFELLPVHGFPEVGPTFERYFLTPPVVNVALAAEAFGVQAVVAAGRREVYDAVNACLAGRGATVIDVPVGPDGAQALRRLTAALDARLAGPEGCFGS